MIQKFYALLFCLVAFATVATAQTTRTITDADLTTGDYTWSKDTIYLLDGNVFLEGGSLTIEEGTVIKGKGAPTTGDISSTLIITRGAQIFANGTADEPIIFTGELDQLDGSLMATDNQLWGGLIILGNAPIGEDVDIAVSFPQTGIEGVPSTEARAIYGGTDDEDNSGSLTYVSIRHGGSILAGDNEINGLTMGGVGSKTVINHVEVFANKDDGIEIFGGTVNCKNVIAAFVGDDGLDFDESWNGFIQFAMTITYDDAILGEHSVEYDGSEDASGTQPRTTGRIYNATFIGGGENGANTDSRGLRLRNEADAQFWNCIWTEFTDYVFRWDENARTLTLANNIVGTFGGALDRNNRGITGFTQEDPTLAGISWDRDGGLDPRLDAGSPALTGAAIPSSNEDGTLIKPPFRGAFGNQLNWADGWTALADNGYFGDLATPEPTPLVTITDADIEAGGTLTLDPANEYLLDGNVFVEDGATLIIPAGTVIRGQAVPSTGDISSTLVIARGGRIEATGTAEEPIIFTSELDDLNGNLQATDNQLWGGVIILGAAPIGEDIDDSVGFPQTGIEGVPSTEARAIYGGTDPEDDSGIFTYVSIRHGGSILAADNEINGLTMGGVGSDTEISNVEVYANKDDGIEIFGGTVNVKNAVVAFCGDDALDFDESWNGFVQFALTITYDDAILGEHAVEYDGSEDASGTQPRTTGRI
ncbi:MAG: T9SS C-terminal target domain-containing protein, partial [Bacteroidota bacterium]